MSYEFNRNLLNVQKFWQEKKNNYMIKRSREYLIKYSYIIFFKINCVLYGLGCENIMSYFGNDNECRFKMLNDYFITEIIKIIYLSFRIRILYLLSMLIQRIYNNCTWNELFECKSDRQVNIRCVIFGYVTWRLKNDSLLISTTFWNENGLIKYLATQEFFKKLSTQKGKTMNNR